MDVQQVLNDNYRAENNSFLYYLHEESSFNEEAYSCLCECITELKLHHIKDECSMMKINFIYSQILKHIIYHFDPDDSSMIEQLPVNYYEKLEVLDAVIQEYYK